MKDEKIICPYCRYEYEAGDFIEEDDYDYSFSFKTECDNCCSVFEVDFSKENNKLDSYFLKEHLETERNLLVLFIEDSKKNISETEEEIFRMKDTFNDDINYILNLHSHVEFRKELIKFASKRLEKVDETLGLFI